MSGSLFLVEEGTASLSLFEEVVSDDRYPDGLIFLLLFFSLSSKSLLASEPLEGLWILGYTYQMVSAFMGIFYLLEDYKK